MRKNVETIFDEFVPLLVKKREVVNYIINHERKKKVIDNLCGQIEIAERRSYQITWNAERYRYVIGEVAKMFCSAALKKIEDDLKSNAARQKIIDDANRLSNFEKELEEDTKEALSNTFKSYPIGK